MLTKATGSPLLVNGTFTASTSTVNYSGGTSNGIATTTYYNLTVNTAGTLTGNVTSTNLLTINTGKSLAGATFNLTPDQSHWLAALNQRHRCLHRQHFNVIYAGATSNGIATTTYYNLTVDTDGTLTGNATSTNLLTINTGKSLAGATFNLT